MTAVPLGWEKGDRKGICQPFREQPGSAGSRKAAHQLAATLKNRSESPPAYSTYLKTSVTRFGKIKHIVSRKSRHHLHIPAQLRSSVERTGQMGKQRSQLDSLAPAASGAQTLLSCSSVSFPGAVRLMSVIPPLCWSTKRIRQSGGLPSAREEHAVLGWAVQRGTKQSQRTACAFSKEAVSLPQQAVAPKTRCLE